MANLNGFDAHTVPPDTGFEPVPAGNYVAAITGSEMKKTNSGTGEYLELEFVILEGPYKGRRLWARLNLNNPSQTAVNIARSELSAICHAVGVMQPRDSVELHNLPMQISVKIKKRKDTGDLVNEISKYEKRQAGMVQTTQPAAQSFAQPPAQPVAQMQAQPQPQGTNNMAPPWQR